MPPNPTPLVAVARAKLPNPPVGEPIAIVDLALELSAPVVCLEYLIERGYLQLHARGDSPFTTTVIMPDPYDVQWLRGMLAPLPKRPMLPFEVVAQCLDITDDTLREFLNDADIAWYADPVFGEVLSLEAYRRLVRSLSRERNAVPIDRVSMVRMFAPFVEFTPPSAVRMRVEQEISRVSKLEEPDRTLRAAAIWEAYTDTKAFMRLLNSDSGAIFDTAAMAEMDKKMEVVEECLSTQRPWCPNWHQRRYYKTPRATRMERIRKMHAGRWAKRAARRNAAISAGESSEPARLPASESSAGADVPSNPTEPSL